MHSGWSDGATAVVAWVLDNSVVVANVGDAKAVLARTPPGAPAPPKAVVLTKEHKAMHEVDRIVKAKGRVVNGRLDGAQCTPVQSALYVLCTAQGGWRCLGRLETQTSSPRACRACPM